MLTTKNKQEQEEEEEGVTLKLNLRHEVLSLSFLLACSF
jgi:hypothetical protein